MHVDKDIMQKD